MTETQIDCDGVRDMEATLAALRALKKERVRQQQLEAEILKVKAALEKLGKVK